MGYWDEPSLDRRYYADNEPECEHQHVEVDLFGAVTWCLDCGEDWPARPHEIKRQRKRDREMARREFFEKWLWCWLCWPWRRYRAWKAERDLRRSLEEEIPF
jgi:hypothetical protein